MEKLSYNPGALVLGLPMLAVGGYFLALGIDMWDGNLDFMFDYLNEGVEENPDLLATGDSIYTVRTVASILSGFGGLSVIMGAVFLAMGFAKGKSNS